MEIARSRLDKALRRFVSATTVVFGLVFLGTVATLFVPPVRGWVTAPERKPAYVVGDKVDLPDSYYSKADRTLVIFARSSCAGCQRAKPLLKKAAGAGKNTDRSRVLLTAGSDLAAEARYAGEVGLEPWEFQRAPDGLRVDSVPTLLIVDREGTILLSREGIVWSPEVEKAVLREVSAVLRDQ